MPSAKMLEQEIRKRFPIENYGILKAYRDSVMIVDGEMNVSFPRDTREVREWWDCWDASAAAAELTDGSVMATQDTSLGLYTSCHFVCNADIEGKKRSIDGTPMFPFVRSIETGRPYLKKKEMFVLSGGLSPFSFNQKNGKAFHSQIRVFPDVEYGELKSRAAYLCVLIEDGQVTEAFDKTYSYSESMGLLESISHVHSVRQASFQGEHVLDRRRSEIEGDAEFLKYAEDEQVLVQLYLKEAFKKADQQQLN